MAENQNKEKDLEQPVEEQEETTEAAAEEKETSETPEAEEKESAEEVPEKKSKFFKKDKKDKKDAEIEELKDRLVRQMAEFDNYRKRTDKEKKQNYEIGASDFNDEFIRETFRYYVKSTTARYLKLVIPEGHGNACPPAAIRELTVFGY